MKNLLLLLFPCLMLLSCNSNTTDGVDYTELSKAFCNCGQNSIKISDQMLSLMKKNKHSAFEELVPKASAAFTEAVQCSQSIKDKHPDLTLDAELLTERLKANCPNMPNKFISDLLAKIK